MARIAFKINDTTVKKKLSSLLNGVKNFKEPLKKAEERLMPYFSETVFESQGSVLGESWRSLAESTLRARAKRSGYYKRPPIATGKILIWTGRLQRGFRSEITKDSLVIRNNVPYFKYHQDSQRKMLAINNSVTLIVQAEIQKYIEKLLK